MSGNYPWSLCWTPAPASGLCPIAYVCKTKPDHLTPLLRTLQCLPISLLVQTKLSWRLHGPTPSGPQLPPNSLCWGHAGPLAIPGAHQASMCLSLSALCFSAQISSHRYSQQSPSQFPELLAQKFPHRCVLTPASVEEKPPPSPCSLALSGSIASSYMEYFSLLVQLLSLSLVYKQPVMGDLFTHYPRHRVNAYEILVDCMNQRKQARNQDDLSPAKPREIWSLGSTPCIS